MTKNQKLWFWIGLALFAIPEILWSPLSNYVYELSQVGGPINSLRSNFLTTDDKYNFTWYGLLLLIQFIGLCSALTTYFRVRQIFKNKLLFWLCFSIFLLLLFISLMSFYLVTFISLAIP